MSKTTHRILLAVYIMILATAVVAVATMPGRSQTRPSIEKLNLACLVFHSMPFLMTEWVMQGDVLIWRTLDIAVFLFAVILQWWPLPIYVFFPKMPDGSLGLRFLMKAYLVLMLIADVCLIIALGLFAIIFSDGVGPAN